MIKLISTIKPILSDLINLQLYANTKALPEHKRTNVTSTGDHVGKHLGRGMDFAEFRHYQAGDDVRTIDWRVSARTSKVHIRVYCEERERPVFILVDQGQTMQFGTQLKFKAVLAAQIAAILAWSALKNKNSVGSIITGIAPELTLKPRRGKVGVLGLLQALTQHHTATRPEWDSTLRQLRLLAKAGSIICLISDFDNFSVTARHHVQQLAKRNDILCVHVSDPLERHAPPGGRYLVSDGVQAVTINTYDKNFCQHYNTHFQAQFEQTKTLCAQSGMQFMSAVTNENIEHIMTQR